MKQPDGTIVYLTAGGAGMFCGSCMHDNTMAAALTALGCDVVLVPLYTPIRTDETNVSSDQVFFGGINVFLQQRVPLFRYLPGVFDRWLDRPWLLNRLASRSIRVAAEQLGDLTVSMLRGEHGNQRKEVRRLVDWLASDLRPVLVNLSNILIAGCVEQIKARLHLPVLVTLQGDDLFLEDLVEPYKSQAMAEIRRIAQLVDGFIVFSQYYADFMAEYLQVPRERFHVVPLGLDLEDYGESGQGSGRRGQGSGVGGQGGEEQRKRFVGYLARVCPEKGLHLLVDAFVDLARRPGMEGVELRVAGWLGAANQRFLEEQRRKIAAAGLSDRFRYEGVLERQQKIDFLASLDVLSVPTVYHEPKGLFVLEALASGVPVVQPAHGAFPELLAATGGGRLVRPGDTRHLADTLGELLVDDAARRELGRQGQQRVFRDFSAPAIAAQTLAVYREHLKK
jgi:glycosyltransferase involved in cell wall biosynthesis